jgi:putative ABC transport system permease protein
MNFTRLLLENLLYHRRGNFAVLLGVIVGTAVLTGALLVGDSLRGSLRQLTEEQLGWVELSLINNSFFREDVVRNPENKNEVRLTGDHLAPVVLLQVTVAKLDKNQQAAGRTLRKVTLVGADRTFWGPKPNCETELGGMSAEHWEKETSEIVGRDATIAEVVLNAALARELQVTVGDVVQFHLQRESSAPRESLLGKRDTADVLATFSMQVEAVLPPEHFGSRFNLNPGATLPRTAYLPLRVLQRMLVFQQTSREARKRFPDYPINAILVQGGQKHDLDTDLKKHLSLQDYGLDMRASKFPGHKLPEYLSLESRSMFVPNYVQEAVNKTGLPAAPTLVYLVNNMADASSGEIQIPYCVVAALDPKLDPPLGPFLPKEIAKLADTEILLVDWEDNPLHDAKKGTLIELTYFEPNDQGNLREVTNKFTLAADVTDVPLEDARKDAYLTPLFPGVTDQATMDSWEAPFPFEKSRVKPRDENFWEEFRTTPKAYITLAAGKKLWASHFGDTTSLRIVPGDDIPRDKVPDAILQHLDPERGGFTFMDIRASNITASAGSQDFSGLFLGFSCFLIVAALLLVGLLFRLNIDRRASEIGLLLAVGHRRSTVRWLLLAEGAMISVIGGVLGLLLAVWYAGWLLDFLRTSWPDQQLDWSFLRLQITPTSLLIGFFSSVVVSVLTIFWAIRILGKVSPRNLLSGETTGPENVQAAGKSLWSLVVLGVGVVGTVGCIALGPFIHDHMIQAIVFLFSGMFLLTAGLALAWISMRRKPRTLVTEGGVVGLARLGSRNAGRHPVRSILTMGLLAFATFLVVAVQAFHRDPGAHFLEKDGGSGGYPFVAEADVPIFLDLNDPKAQEEISDNKEELNLLKSTRFVPFRLKQGDDVSCLNLYKPKEPRVLGVPDAIVRGGGFDFAASEAETDEEKENPWLLLDRHHEDGVIPVFGEKNTVTYVLGKGLGQTLEVTGGDGKKVTLRIVGLLHDSVFQSELLMSDANFRQVYPKLEGFQYFLIEAPVNAALPLQPLQTMLEQRLGQYGVAVEQSSKKLETFLAVENTYLATFQALGGLGLLLGALGLAVVLLRSVWERRGELALFRALGFRRAALGWLVLAENLYLLILGLATGTIAALIAVAPHVLSGAEVRWLELAGLLGLVLVVGLAATTIAVAFTVRAPLIAALRKN